MVGFLGLRHARISHSMKRFHPGIFQPKTHLLKTNSIFCSTISKSLAGGLAHLTRVFAVERILGFGENNTFLDVSETL